MKKSLQMFLTSTFVLTSLTACGGIPDNHDTDQEARPTNSSIASENRNRSAVAEIFNTKEEKIGRAMFTETEDGVRIHLDASKLSPGVHGFHIHETGKCEPPEFKSAGGHFNPTNKEHGFNNPKGFHAGDLPNIKVNENGMVSISMMTKEVTLAKGKPNSLLDADGSAIVIHEKADDYKTNPAGNAGNRVGCGVIQSK